MRWWLSCIRRHRHEERIQDAEHELEISRKRLQEAREKVIKPLAEAAAKNNFAEMIRASLVAGHNGRGQSAT